MRSCHFLRFAPQVLGSAPLNADELRFAQFFLVPVFTGLQAQPEMEVFRSNVNKLGWCTYRNR